MIERKKMYEEGLALLRFELANALGARRRESLSTNENMRG
jgi:hypothetical protein